MRPEPSGTDEGILTVCLDVDGQMDIVYSDLTQSGDLASLWRDFGSVYGPQPEPPPTNVRHLRAV